MSAVASTRSRAMKLGAEPRKLIILGSLVAVAIAVALYNGNDEPTGGSSSTNSIRTAATPPGGISDTTHRRTRRRLAASTTGPACGGP